MRLKEEEKKEGVLSLKKIFSFLPHLGKNSSCVLFCYDKDVFKNLFLSLPLFQATTRHDEEEKPRKGQDKSLVLAPFFPLSLQEFLEKKEEMVRKNL